MEALRITNPHRKWYQIIAWWELRRIPYNIIMILVGMGSFYVGYVTIPLVYLVIGLALNGVYTLNWSLEMIVSNLLGNRGKILYPRIAFTTYLIISAITVFGIAFYLILR